MHCHPALGATLLGTLLASASFAQDDAHSELATARQISAPAARFEALRALEQEHPDFAPLQLELGILRMDAGDIDRALVHLERSLGDPWSAYIGLFHIAQIHHYQQDFTGALDALRRARSQTEALARNPSTDPDWVAWTPGYLQQITEIETEVARDRTRLERLEGARRTSDWILWSTIGVFGSCLALAWIRLR